MNFKKLPKGIAELSEIFLAHGYKLYIVGGYVRNLTLGISGGDINVSDIDVCSSALPETASAFLRKAGLAVIEKAPLLGTIEIHLHTGGEKAAFEHTTFRRDYYPPGGTHRPCRVEFTSDMQKDARRRDFTVNVLYLDTQTKEITDPTGKGLKDLKNRILRAAADDPRQTLRDDGLRIMRMARFAAELGFSVDKELLKSAKENAALLEDISVERKRDELVKILLADTKYKQTKKDESAPKYGLELLVRTGALCYVLPILCKGQGVAQNEKYHSHDVLNHEINSCALTPPILALRLAALLHDIGKPEALEKSGNMYSHEIYGEKLAEKELANLKFDNAAKKTVLTLIKNHMFDLEGKAKPKTIRKRAIKLGRQIFSMLIELRRADFLGSGKGMLKVVSADNWQKELDRMEEQKVPWSVLDLAISGDDIKNALKLSASPKIGQIIEFLFKECVMSPKMNNKNNLIKRAKEYAKSEEWLP